MILLISEGVRLGGGEAGEEPGWGQDTLQLSLQLQDLALSLVERGEQASNFLGEERRGRSRGRRDRSRRRPHTGRLATLWLTHHLRRMHYHHLH